MIAKIIVMILAAAVSGIFYRMGGSGNNSRLWRRIGVPLICAALAGILGIGHLTLALCVLIMYGSITTYWDFINPWLRVPDPGREYWWNWALHGFFFAAAMFPLVIALDLWTGFWIRNVVAGILVCFWSETQGDAVVEEIGRGVILAGSIPLLLIGAA
jgi:hypothetical protein